MRRRHKKNTLIWRILGVSILVHILALPILAHYGAFKKIEQRYLDTRLVTLPPPPKEQAKQESRQPKHVAAKTQTARKSASTSRQNRQAQRQAAVNIPKVIASGNGPGGGSAEPSVAANGTGKVGEVPAPAPTTTASPPAPAPATKPEPKPQPAAEPTPKTVETPKAPPQPKPLETPPPKAPVFTDVAATFSPQPAIPDDLRTDALDRTVVIEFTVGPDGSPITVKIAQSTGVDALDRIALDTARKWKFKPATRDGEPVESVVRLHIEFQVS